MFDFWRMFTVKKLKLNLSFSLDLMYNGAIAKRANKIRHCLHHAKLPTWAAATWAKLGGDVDDISSFRCTVSVVRILGGTK